MPLSENLTERFVDALIVTKNKLRDDYWIDNQGKKVSDPDRVLAIAETMLEVRRASYLKDGENYTEEEVGLRKWVDDLTFLWSFWMIEARASKDTSRKSFK